MPLLKENWQISWVELQTALRSQFSSLASLTEVMRALKGVEQKEVENLEWLLPKTESLTKVFSPDPGRRSNPTFQFPLVDYFVNYQKSCVMGKHGYEVASDFEEGIWRGKCEREHIDPPGTINH